MPSNHTPNYQLSQWEKSDKVLMEDFNADNAKIDAAIQAVERRADDLAAGKVDPPEITRLEQLIGAKAAIVTGFYAGDDTEIRTIELGFTPKALLLMTDSGRMFSSYSNSCYGGLAFSGQPVTYNSKIIVTIVENGFQVYYNANDKIYSNRQKNAYRYLALR